MPRIVFTTIAGGLIGIAYAAIVLGALQPVQMAMAYLLGGLMGLSVGAMIPVLRASG